MDSGGDDSGERGAIGRTSQPIVAAGSGSPVASSNDPTRTAAPSPDVALTDDGADERRRLAPLQYRDPSRYRILGEHGRGGLGRVFRARDKELGRDLAIKELLQRGTASELRFFREALITARLEHPGIVPVHEAGRWPDGTPFYAMKLVQGRPLRALIDECKTPEDRLALLPHVVAVADAISYAHDRNIIHRDLKPANVIVGAFGETVVIDWGLAKDLSSNDDDDRSGVTDAGEDELGVTVAGSVLGTPAYMAPEQRAGRADRRSDVYAIGGILFHVLSGQPPNRGADNGLVNALGTLPHYVGRDLSSIVGQAMHSDREQRYQAAVTLADDLRRYMRRRPIAARRYSLAGRALLAFARHRTAASITFAASLILAIVLGVANWRIVAERQQAIQSKTRSEESLAALTLDHAELLLQTDPSAALDILADYQGSNRSTATRLSAEAKALGSALTRATPHTAAILWIRGLPDGAFISLAIDGTIAKTTIDGTSRVLARAVTPKNSNSYSEICHILAYACDPDRVCLLDVLTGAPIPAPQLIGLQPSGVSFSASGALLAVLSHDGRLTVWNVSFPNKPSRLIDYQSDGGTAVLFVGERMLAVSTRKGLELVPIANERRRVPIEGINAWDASATGHEIALGTNGGDIVLVDALTGNVIAKQSACAGPVNDLRLIPGRGMIGYACQNAVVGTWAVDSSPKVRAHLQGSADLTAVSSDGSYFVVGGSDGSVLVVDMTVGLMTTYRGHRSRLSAISAPEVDRPFLLSADARGRVRMWPLPNRIAQVVIRADTPIYDALFLSGSQSLVATGGDGLLHSYSVNSGSHTYGPHETSSMSISASEDGRYFATSGLGEVVEVWSSGGIVKQKVIETHQGTVSQAVFVENGVIATSGYDGKVLLWRDGLEPSVVASLPRPVVRMMFLRAKRVLVLLLSNGELWRSDLNGNVALIEAARNRSFVQRALNDSLIVSGDADGVIETIDTNRWQSRGIAKISDGVRQIAFSRQGNLMAVSTRDGHVYLGTPSVPELGWISWTSFDAGVQSLVFSPSGDLLMATCNDGMIWFYLVGSGRWYYLTVGAPSFGVAMISPDGGIAMAADYSGRIVLIRLDLVRDALAVDHKSRGVDL